MKITSNKKKTKLKQRTLEISWENTSRMKGKTQPHNKNISLLIIKVQMYNVLCLMQIYNNRKGFIITERSLEIPIIPMINNNSSNIHASMHENDTCHIHLILQIKLKCPFQLKIIIIVITSIF